MRKSSLYPHIRIVEVFDDLRRHLNKVLRVPEVTTPKPLEHEVTYADLENKISLSDPTLLRAIFRRFSKMRPTKLENLPPALLHPISEYLSSTDATCLALCSRHFMASSFHNMLNRSFPPGHTGQPDEELRIEFLTRLACDLPQYHVCFVCLRLRLWKYIDYSSLGFNFTACYHAMNDEMLLVP